MNHLDCSAEFLGEVRCAVFLNVSVSDLSDGLQWTDMLVELARTSVYFTAAGGGPITINMHLVINSVFLDCCLR